MIIPEKKILFVHIPKTGGQSVTKFFLENLGEKANLKNAKYGLINNKKNKRQGPHHFHHLLLKEYEKLGLVNDVKEYFKITVVRNPYSRFISAYYFNKLQNDFSFREVLDRLPFADERSDLYRMFIPQTNYLTVDNKIQIDKVFYQENLDDFFEFFLKKYKMSGSVYTNKSKIKITDSFLKDDEIQLINKIYYRDFQDFGYKFR